MVTMPQPAGVKEEEGGSGDRRSGMLQERPLDLPVRPHRMFIAREQEMGPCLVSAAQQFMLEVVDSWS